MASNLNITPQLPTPPLVEDSALQLWINSIQQAIQSLRTGLQIVSLDPADALVTINGAATSALTATDWTEWDLETDLDIPFNAKALILDGRALVDSAASGLNGACFTEKYTTSVLDGTGDVSSVTTVDGNTKIDTSTALGSLNPWADVFGDILDTAHWEESVLPFYVASDSYSVSKVGQKLRVSVTESSSTWSGWGVKGLLTFAGDFNRQIDLNITEGSNQYVIFLLYNDADNWMWLAKRKDGATSDIYAYTKVDGSITYDTFNTTNTTPQFKLIRSGTTLECWYNVGAGWVKLHDYTGATSIGTLTLYLGIVAKTGTTATCDFNNFTANSGAPYWDDSPVITLEQEDFGERETVDMSSIAVTSSGSGSLKYQYATDEKGTSWNDTWLTLAQLQAIANPESRYFRLKAQMISDGTQDVILTDISYDRYLGRSWLISGAAEDEWAARILILPLYNKKLFYTILAPDGDVDLELRKIGWIIELI